MTLFSASRNLGKRLVIIQGGSFIASRDATFLAGVYDRIVGTRPLDGRRLHHAAAIFRAVTRGNIHMLAPEALWTMVGIAIAFNKNSTILTSKIFFCTNKSR